MTPPPKPLAKTTARGYGNEHQNLRRQWAPKVAAGRTICWRCRNPILPGQPWDLGHHPHNRNQYAGPEHTSCNRGARRNARLRPRPTALGWFGTTTPSKHSS